MNIRFIKNKSQNLKRRNEINNNVKLQKIIFSLICMLFLLGVLAGSIYLKNVTIDSFVEENKNILENVIDENINSEKIFVESLSKNIITLIFIWIIGLSILGVPILLFFVLYDGFSLGVTIAYILKTFGIYEGYKFIFPKMYIVTTINSFIVFLLCYNAIKVTLNILRQKSDLKIEFIRYSVVCTIMVVFMIFSSTLESFFMFK